MNMQQNIDSPFPVLERPLPVFCSSYGDSDFVQGRPRTEEFVPGVLLLPLSREKGTTGRPVQTMFSGMI